MNTPKSLTHDSRSFAVKDKNTKPATDRAATWSRDYTEVANRYASHCQLTLQAFSCTATKTNTLDHNCVTVLSNLFQVDRYAKTSVFIQPKIMIAGRDWLQLSNTSLTKAARGFAIPLNYFEAVQRKAYHHPSAILQCIQRICLACTGVTVQNLKVSDWTKQNLVGALKWSKVSEVLDSRHCGSALSRIHSCFRQMINAY